MRQLLYHKGVDDHIVTWGGNYVVAATAIICAVVMLVLYGRKHYRNRGKLTFIILEATHFLTLGHVNLFTGIIRHLFPHTEDFPGTPMAYKVLWRLVLTLM